MKPTVCVLSASRTKIPSSVPIHRDRAEHDLREHARDQVLAVAAAGALEQVGAAGLGRPDVTPEDRARMHEMLATGEYPRLAVVLGQGGGLAPPPDTFEAGLEWLLDGMQAALDARRG